MKRLNETSAYAADLLPTAWQNVIFVNYGKVATRDLAVILHTDEKTVTAEAERMGLGRIRYDARWAARGYVTAIRDNWNLLPQQAIARLIGVTEDEYDTILKTEDFLGIKQGAVPALGDVRYRPLTADEIARTEKARVVVESAYIEPTARPFDFFGGNEAGAAFSAPGERVVYSYCARYGDVLAEGWDESFPDELLGRYAARGVTGLWLEGRLALLAPSPYGEDDGLAGLRRRNLRALCEKCARYGLGIFLYFNEPRALPEAIVPERVGGRKADGLRALCVLEPEVKEYLASATELICREVPSLSGIISLTMSENFTHCACRSEASCGRRAEPCSYLLPVTIDNMLAEGAKRAGGKVRVVANLWGWAAFCGWTDEMQEKAIEALDPYVEVMIVSENGMKIDKGGVASKVEDYSISNVGPADDSVRLFRVAKRCGHRMWAKIQTSTSWECPAAPALPVYPLVWEHVRRLRALGVSELMCCWTLGGYPSSVLDAVACECAGMSEDEFYASRFGKHASAVAEASELFCKGFAEFPYSLNVLYFSPHCYGPGELWSSARIPYEASMVTYSYDDVGRYAAPFGEAIYVSQMQKATQLMRAACDKFAALPRGVVPSEIVDGAECACLHYTSAMLKTEFTVRKLAGFPDPARAVALTEAEEECVKRLYALQARDARIGFEATQQYYYNENSLLLKLVNLHVLRDKLRLRAAKAK